MYVEIKGEYIGADTEVVKWNDKKTGEPKQFSYIEGQILQTVPTEKGEKLEVVYIRFPESFDPQSVPLKTEIELEGVVEYDTFNRRTYLAVEGEI